VHKRTGAHIRVPQGSTGPQFTGTVREWYETLVETIIGCVNELHARVAAKNPSGLLAHDRQVTLRCNPETIKLIECSVLYKTKDTYPSSEGEIDGMRALVDETLDKELIMIDVSFAAQGDERVYVQGAVKVDWHG
jgi:hypothetical protein